MLSGIVSAQNSTSVGERTVTSLSTKEQRQCRAGFLGLINPYARWLVVVQRLVFVLMAGMIPGGIEGSHSLAIIHLTTADTMLCWIWPGKNQSLKLLLSDESLERGSKEVTWLRPHHLLKWQSGLKFAFFKKYPFQGLEIWNLLQFFLKCSMNYVKNFPEVPISPSHPCLHRILTY